MLTTPSKDAACGPALPSGADPIGVIPFSDAGQAHHRAGIPRALVAFRESSHLHPYGAGDA
jgi:hypothetical protein